MVQVCGGADVRRVSRHIQLGGSREWTSVDTQQSNDIYQDNILMHSGGSSNHSASLGYWRPYKIADGKVRAANVLYLLHNEAQYFKLMTANKNLILYLKINVKGRSIGTLAVFVDQGIVEDRPLLALHVKLSLLLDLPDSLAYVGFTASVGRQWQKHKIKRWESCDWSHSP